MAVTKKKRAYKEWLQNKDEISCQQYKVKKKRARRTVCNAKVNADESWGRKLTANFQENKIFWIT